MKGGVNKREELRKWLKSHQELGEGCLFLVSQIVHGENTIELSGSRSVQLLGERDLTLRHHRTSPVPPLALRDLQKEAHASEPGKQHNR